MLSKDEIRRIVDGERGPRNANAEVDALRERVKELEWYIDQAGPAIVLWLEVLRQHNAEEEYFRTMVKDCADVERLARWRERLRRKLTELRKRRKRGQLRWAFLRTRGAGPGSKKPGRRAKNCRGMRAGGVKVE